MGGGDIIRKAIVVFAVLSIMIIPMIILSNQTEAASSMKITNDNIITLMRLRPYTFNNYRLLWYYGRHIDSIGGERSIGPFLQHSYPSGYYWGECVSSCKALCSYDQAKYTTSQWMKGQKVMPGGVSTGFVIANFDESGRYSGHSAIMKKYYLDGSGISVWDSNWKTYNGQPVFGVHKIGITGTGVNNANNYHVVRVPSN